MIQITVMMPGPKNNLLKWELHYIEVCNILGLYCKTKKNPCCNFPDTKNSWRLIKLQKFRPKKILGTSPQSLKYVSG